MNKYISTNLAIPYVKVGPVMWSGLTGVINKQNLNLAKQGCQAAYGAASAASNWVIDSGRSLLNR